MVGIIYGTEPMLWTVYLDPSTIRDDMRKWLYYNRMLHVWRRLDAYVNNKDFL